jgi:predicted choloylglycine hydrolase
MIESYHFLQTFQTKYHYELNFFIFNDLADSLKIKDAFLIFFFIIKSDLYEGSVHYVSSDHR